MGKLNLSSRRNLNPHLVLRGTGLFEILDVSQGGVGDVFQGVCSKKALMAGD